MVEDEACHFCVACGAHNAIFVPPAACKTRYVVFICPFFLVPFEIAHLRQILVMVEGEACNFCAACGAHNAIFVPPAACERRPRQGTWSSFAHFFLVPFVIAHLHQILATIAGEAHAIFAPPAARIMQTTPSTRYVVFICPFLSCFFFINYQRRSTHP
jgi:hypothetical protein